MSIKKWPGAVVSDVKVEPAGPYQDSAASGVWTLEQQAYWEAQGLWPVPGNLNPDSYIENIFQTYLYTGNGATQTITNGIDLANEGGMTWVKQRSAARDNLLFDTSRGATQRLFSNLTLAQSQDTQSLTAFNSDGFSVGSDSGCNISAGTYASWTFRKKPKFFDVVTYTGDGTGTALQVPHNLGSKPGCIFIKRTDSSGDWGVLHQGNNTAYTAAWTGFSLNNGTSTNYYGSTLNLSSAVSDTFFRPHNVVAVDGSRFNVSGATYVAYLFAHDAGGFGDDGLQNVISCGSYTGNGSTNGPVINLGYEPQWLLVKSALGSTDWYITDNMMGIPNGGVARVLKPNLTDAEGGLGPIDLLPTGFQIRESYTAYNASGIPYIYIAIRRGPMATPTSGTEVFAAQATTSSATDPGYYSGFPVDFGMYNFRASTGSTFTSARLVEPGYLQTNSTAAEVTTAPEFKFDYMDGFRTTGGSGVIAYSFRRAPGFFDVVAYTGTGSARTVNHNLGVVPELMIVKKRSGNGSWCVYHEGVAVDPETDYLFLESTAAASDSTSFWNDTAPTSTNFTVGTYTGVNLNGETFIAYLFATVAGVSKVGSYTGTAADINVDCGFTTGARFVLIKRTDTTGDWYIWDSARGIVAGNDPYLLLNSSAAEVTGTDYVDADPAGFTVTSSAPAGLNASGGSYIFLAIA